MRKFTKGHNDLNWLFPNVTGFHDSEKTFDEFEDIGNDILLNAYWDQKTFTRDDMMDAFMKGASVTNQMLGERIVMANQCNSTNNCTDELQNLRDENKILKEMMDKLLINYGK